MSLATISGGGAFTRQNINEVKEHTKIIDQNVQLILQELRAMKAVQEAERARSPR